MAPHNYRNTVVRYHPLRAGLLLLAAVILLLVVIVGVYVFGVELTRSRLTIDPHLYAEMEGTLGAVRGENSELNEQLLQQEIRTEVDRQALELVRKEMSLQQQRISELEEGLNFYRSLMAPKEIAQGLSIRDLELISVAGSGRRFGFRIVAQQEARKHSTVKGEISVEIFGEIEGEPERFHLSELCDDLEGEAQPLRFLYFQAIEGELVLPEGFTPRGVEVVARATAPSITEISKQFAWQIQERFTHVGK